MSIISQIQAKIHAAKDQHIFCSRDFLSIGGRASVDQALSRLVRQGRIARLARGVYGSTHVQPESSYIALAIARRTGESIGRKLLNSETSDQVVIPTTGATRSIQMQGQWIRFCRMSHRKIELSQTARGRVLLELWNKGQSQLTRTEIQKATGHWSVEAVNEFAELIPTWLLQAIRQSNAPKKSIQIGLVGAYDWSNPNIKDDVLIEKVIESYRFDDLAKLCVYYGLPRVKRIFFQRPRDPVTQASVARMLKNIGKGLRLARKGDRTQPAKTEFLKGAQKLPVSSKGFELLSIEGLFVMKSLVVYDRIRSRDIYDLMILCRDHGFTLDQAFAAISAYQPEKNKDPERFKSVVTGVLPLDADDEGFMSIQLKVRMQDIYRFFKKMIETYEVNAAKALGTATVSRRS